MTPSKAKPFADRWTAPRAKHLAHVGCLRRRPRPCGQGRSPNMRPPTSGSTEARSLRPRRVGGIEKDAVLTVPPNAAVPERIEAVSTAARARDHGMSQRQITKSLSSQTCGPRHRQPSYRQEMWRASANSSQSQRTPTTSTSVGRVTRRGRSLSIGFDFQTNDCPLAETSATAEPPTSGSAYASMKNRVDCA